MDEPSVEALLASESWSDAGNINHKMIAQAFDAFAAKAVTRERARCLHWAAGSAHTAQHVIDAIERGTEL
jgi:hypothetical protein